MSGTSGGEMVSPAVGIALALPSPASLGGNTHHDLCIL